MNKDQSRISDLIFETVKRWTEVVYMLPGGGAMYLVDSLGRSGIAYVTAAHEQAAGYMAVAHAMVSGGLGVCLVTTGPGATNALTPCAGAWADSVSVLFISGQARIPTLIGDSGRRTNGVQEIDIIPMVKPITKMAVRLMEGVGFKVRFTLEDLIYTALEGRRGPVWLDVPLDVQGAQLGMEGRGE